ncbi:MAG: DegT/DnrJ/EryC1/StrS family aminotransferase [Phycisphaerales bacterium]|nr:MAG: DegT/DnrJ/EryC1/StrS family aminotransferase [Phycisphaerales bacterium]
MRIPDFASRLSSDEISEVLRTLESTGISEGPRTHEFEQLLSEYIGCRHVILVPNGTLALFAALKVLGIGPGDEVIVPDLTFYGTASAVILTGARPVLVDVRESDGNIDPASAEASISTSTRAILPVHLFGQSCDMDALTDLVARHNLWMVEDAAQGMGTTFGSRHVGTFGDIGCLSFVADKTLTTGEGGALVTDDDDLADRCRWFKNHGRRLRTQPLHDHVGLNLRITDVQAAIGVANFRRLDETIARKRALWDAYVARLSDCPGVRPWVDNGFGRAVPFRICIRVADPAALSDHLARCGIGTRRFYPPLHRQPGLTLENCVIHETPTRSVRLYETGLMLPSSLDLTDDQIDHVCACVREFCERSGDATDALLTTDRLTTTLPQRDTGEVVELSAPAAT